MSTTIDPVIVSVYDGFGQTVAVAHVDPDCPVAQLPEHTVLPGAVASTLDVEPCETCVNGAPAPEQVEQPVDPRIYKADRNGQAQRRGGARHYAPSTTGASEKQAAFIRNLCAERDLDPEPILAECEDRREASKEIDRLKAITPTKGPGPSEKQAAFIRSLADERGLDPDEWVAKAVNKAEASKVIDQLKAIERHHEKNRRPEAVEPPEGVHFTQGVYFKVQVAHHGSGRLYAKRLASGVDDGNKPTWVYEGRQPFGYLSEDTLVTAEQAAQFGQLYGVCVFCGRALTDERSIEVGYGPDCADHHGLPWG